MNSDNENRRDRFKRLATARTNAVLKKLKVLSNCANRQAYEYSEDEVEKIFASIDKYLKSVKSKFHFPKEEKFRL